MPDSCTCLWCGEAVYYGNGKLVPSCDFISEENRNIPRKQTRLHCACARKYEKVVNRLNDQTIPELTGLLHAFKARSVLGIPVDMRKRLRYPRLFDRRTCNYHPDLDGHTRHRNQMMQLLRLQLDGLGDVVLLREAMWLSVVAFKVFAPVTVEQLMSEKLRGLTGYDAIRVEIQRILNAGKIEYPFLGWRGLKQEVQSLVDFRYCLLSYPVLEQLLSDEGIPDWEQERDEDDDELDVNSAVSDSMAELPTPCKRPRAELPTPCKRPRASKPQSLWSLWQKKKNFASRNGKTLAWVDHFVLGCGKFRAMYIAYDVQSWLPHLELLENKVFEREVYPGPGIVQAVEYVTGIDLLCLRPSPKVVQRSAEEMRQTRILMRIIHNRFKMIAVRLHGARWMLFNTEYFLCESRKVWFSWTGLAWYEPKPAAQTAWEGVRQFADAPMPTECWRKVLVPF